MGLENAVGQGLHALSDAMSGVGHAVEEAAKGAGNAAEHVWHGQVDSAKDVANGVVHAAGDVVHGVKQAGHDVAEGARHGNVVGGVLKANEDLQKDGGKALDHTWHGLTKAAEGEVQSTLDGVRDLGTGAGRAYDAGVKGASHAVADVAGKHAGDVVERAAEDAAKPVREVAGFTYGAGGAVAKGALGVVTGTGDLVVGAVRVGTDAELRDKLVATAETVGKAVWKDPKGVARKVKQAAGHAWDGLKKDEKKAEQEGRGAEWWGDKVGGAAFQVATVVVPFTKAAAAAKAAKAAKALSEVEKGGEVLADGAKAAGVMKDAGKVAGNAGRAAPDAKAAEGITEGKAAGEAAHPAPVEAKGPAPSHPESERATPPHAGTETGEAQGPVPPAEVGHAPPPDGTEAAADGEKPKHIALQEGGGEAGRDIRAADRKLNVLTQDDIKKLANTPRDRRSGLLGRLWGPFKQRGAPHIWLKSDALPNLKHDGHMHEGARNSATFDTQYWDTNWDRLAELSDDGRKMSFNFPVAPVLWEPWNIVPRGGEDAAAYYIAREKGENGPANILGRIIVRPKEVEVTGYGIFDADGMPKIGAGKYDRKEFEEAFGGRIPKSVGEVHFLSTPQHASTYYPGVEQDLSNLRIFADRIKAEADAGSSVTMRSRVMGLASSNPFDPKTCDDAFKVLAEANRLEDLHGLTPGTIKIGGNGELTIAKEANERLSHMLPLVDANGDPDMKVIRDISQAIAPMRYAGGVVTIHMDASTSVALDNMQRGLANITTFATKGDAANLRALDALLRENPDQQFIWAHIGAAVTQTVPADYMRQVRTLLENHPNLKIDTSWEPTADMIAGRNKLIDPNGDHVDRNSVQRWGKLIADFPDRFLWGSDTIAASQKKVDTAEGVYEYFKNIGLVDAVRQAGNDRGDRYALEKFQSQNFKDTVLKGANNMEEFRTNGENRKWLEQVASGKPHSRVPPMQQFRDKGGKWKLVPSSELRDGGNRDTYIMPSVVTPSSGAAMVWQKTGLGALERVKGPGRETGNFPLNPNQNRPGF